MVKVKSTGTSIGITGIVQNLSTEFRLVSMSRFTMHGAAVY